MAHPEYTPKSYDLFSRALILAEKGYRVECWDENGTLWRAELFLNREAGEPLPMLLGYIEQINIFDPVRGTKIKIRR